MGGVTISRRNVLRSIATGTAVGAFASGTGSARGGEFNVGTSTGAATREAERRAESVKCVLDFGEIGKAVTGRFSDEDVRELRQRNDVRYVERNDTMHAIGHSDDETLPWGIDRVDAEVAHHNDSDGDGATETGAGAHIAIIDTGIDSNHPDLDANVADPSEDTNHKAVVECGNRRCAGSPCFVGSSTCQEPWDDDHDHGSHVAGIADAEDNSEGVLGVSTQATLHAVKVLDCNGCGSFDDVAAGITWVGNRVDQNDWGVDHAVANMSLGGSKSSVVEDAVEDAYGKGVLLVGAAGNDGSCTDCVGYPAAEPEVIAVSATNKDDCLADFSSQGPEIELAAPGTDIPSTINDGEYDTFSGTSMSSPHVAGSGAQLLANGYDHVTDTTVSAPYPSNPGGARGRLQDTAEDVGLASEEQGEGLVDTAAALGLASTDSAGTCDDGGGGGGGNAPTASVDGVSEAETPSPHAEFDVSWSATDEDGDLDSVTVSLHDDTDGENEGSETVNVSGDSASGTTRLTAKHDDGTGNDYTATVEATDSNGNTGSDSQSFSENGS